MQVIPKAAIGRSTKFIDDNPINLTVASGILEPLKMQIDTAGGASDLEMPVVNGADVFKHLKGIKNAHDTPVVLK